MIFSINSEKRVRVMEIKKYIMILTALGLSLGLLTGCGEGTPLLTAEDYEINTQTNMTSRGISPGDTSEDFLSAYGEYKLFTSTDGETYQVLVTEEIPFDSAITILLPAFFVDGLPIDPDVFCEENGVEKADLITFLSGEDYLASHTVEYRYLIFTWENGVITDIRSASMDYNEDGANWLLYNLA